MAKKGKKEKRGIGKLVGLVVIVLLLVVLFKIAQLAFWIGLVVLLVLAGMYFWKEMNKDKNPKLSVS